MTGLTPDPDLFPSPDLYPGGTPPTPTHTGIPNQVPRQAPHFRFPFTRGTNGKVITVEQGTAEHILSCVNTIVRCPTGWRLERPEFGWPFPMFQNAPLDTAALVNAIETFEPRAHGITATDAADLASAAFRDIEVDIGVSDGD